MEIDRREIARYLGYRDGLPDETVQGMIGQALEALNGCAVPKTLCKSFPLEFPQPGVLRFAGITVESEQLAAHLEGCEQVAVFAATLGSGVDRLMLQAGSAAVSRAVVVQACAAAMIEAVCDEAEQALAAEAAGRGQYLRPRYSPGYGDFPLGVQAQLLGVLDAGKRIGLTLTAGGMLVPTKSVTAVIGLSSRPGECGTHRCAECGKADCAFRRAAENDQ